MRSLVVAVTLMVMAGSAAAQERQVIQVPGALSGLPFSPAVRVGNLIYLSGQIGNLPGTRQLAPGGVAGETRQAMENIRTVLSAAGTDFAHVVKCTVFLVDIADYAAMNEVYAGFFPASPPARSTVAGSGLAFGARVEIECVAAAAS
jgi:reactive intermediate/imine deaminase